jgi:hypothetical protein
MRSLIFQVEKSVILSMEVVNVLQRDVLLARRVVVFCKESG